MTNPKPILDENAITQKVQGAVEVTSNSGAQWDLTKGEREPIRSQFEIGNTRGLVSEFRVFKRSCRDREAGGRKRGVRKSAVWNWKARGGEEADVMGD